MITEHALLPVIPGGRHEIRFVEGRRRGRGRGSMENFPLREVLFGWSIAVLVTTLYPDQPDMLSFTRREDPNPTGGPKPRRGPRTPPDATYPLCTWPIDLLIYLFTLRQPHFHGFRVIAKTPGAEVPGQSTPV